MDEQFAAREWETLTTPSVSDALDRLGIHGQCLGIVAAAPDLRAFGPAFTVRMNPISVAGKTVGDYIDDVPPGSVIVIDNAGRQDVTVWGDLLTVTAIRRGVAGTVIHGAFRDVDQILKLSYPIFSRTWYMRTGKDRVAADHFMVPVSLGDVRVEPEDWIFADGNGVVVIPQPLKGQVLQIATEIEMVEEQIRKAVENGQRLDDARKQHGYFKLQRRTSTSS
ncbi:RraA family protein [bacterium]|nr:RraA family protein [bacterium]